MPMNDTPRNCPVLGRKEKLVVVNRTEGQAMLQTSRWQTFNDRWTRQNGSQPAIACRRPHLQPTRTQWRVPRRSIRSLSAVMVLQPAGYIVLHFSDSHNVITEGKGSEIMLEDK
ncbi:predicted protein [Aspergillus terreus NIH2624]|uniref:Uncharacterized protein n=1 Tax=Aspergillus terreus (strain NIH 2624 / FGSC A1156) TaxID=341663 RepID=Q0CM41_ASPTN|nr:uncharacterized protein ATEG_05243 [Aspergillus terreus NIH2624]EAU34312.1 predicted protein [Aspergillus terreus NIH2624]